MKNGANVREAFQDPQSVKLGGSRCGKLTANLFAAFGCAGHQCNSARR